jgi:hypothetical protein
LVRFSNRPCDEQSYEIVPFIHFLPDDEATPHSPVVKGYKLYATSDSTYRRQRTDKKSGDTKKGGSRDRYDTVEVIDAAGEKSYGRIFGNVIFRAKLHEGIYDHDDDDLNDDADHSTIVKPYVLIAYLEDHITRSRKEVEEPHLASPLPYKQYYNIGDNPNRKSGSALWIDLIPATSIIRGVTCYSDPDTKGTVRDQGDWRVHRFRLHTVEVSRKCYSQYALVEDRNLFDARVTTEAREDLANSIESIRNKIERGIANRQNITAKRKTDNNDNGGTHKSSKKARR